MHLPFVFHIGSVPVEAHLVFEFLSYGLGFAYYRLLRREQGDVLDEESRMWVIIGGIIGAATGSKLLGFLEHPSLSLRSDESVAYFFAGKTIVGGLLGGVLGVECAKKCLGVTRSTGDLFCFPLILGMMIGRIGCFLAGVEDGTWGNPTSLPWGIDGGDGVARHPAPLYDIAVLGLIWWSLAWLKHRVGLKEGALFKLFMVSYLAWRFGVEFLKPVALIEPLGISAIQFACLLGLGYYYKIIVKFSAFRAE